MAWPGSRFTSYVPNNVPVISAAYLNAQQDWTNALTNDTVSVVGLNIDGAGGLAKTAVPGSVKWTNTAAGGGNPTRTTPLPNDLRALNAPKCWGIFRTDLVPSYIDGAAITAGSIPGADPTKFDVTMAQNMATIEYAVQVLAFNYVTQAVLTPNFFQRTAFNQFRVGFAGVDLTADPIEIMVLVFGRQTT